jgi:hypothetical protein
VLVRNPRDLLPRLDDLVTPTIQKPQQLFRIRRNVLQRFAIDARLMPATSQLVRAISMTTTRVLSCTDDYESAILHKGGATDLAVVVGFLQTTAASSGLGSAT